MVKFKSVTAHTMINVTLFVEVQGIKAEVETTMGSGYGWDDGEFYVEDLDIVDYGNVSYNGVPAPEGYKDFRPWADQLKAIAGIDFDKVVDAEVKKLLTEKACKGLGMMLTSKRTVEDMGIMMLPFATEPTVVLTEGKQRD